MIHLTSQELRYDSFSSFVLARVRSSKRRSPEWVILSQFNCFIQGEVIGFQVLLESLHPRSTMASWWSPPVLRGRSCSDLFTSVSSGIRAMWPNREKRRAWWYHLIHNSFHKRHWYEWEAEISETGSRRVGFWVKQLSLKINTGCL